MAQLRSATLGTLLMAVVWLSGCDSLGAAAAQGGEASLRTLIDVLLTNFTNQLADTLSGDENPPPDDGADQNGDDTNDEPTDNGDGQIIDPGQSGFFTSDVQPILNARCINCHSPGAFAQMQGIPWDFREDTAFGDLINQVSSQDEALTLVVPGDPNASLLFLKVSSQSPPVGGMMPLGGPPLTDIEIELIRVWIEQGALEQEDMPADGGDGDAAGSAANGEIIYLSNNCAACHCADASGECALSAPALVGVGAATLDAFLRGDEPHSGGRLALEDQELADLAAYLASLP